MTAVRKARVMIVEDDPAVVTLLRVNMAYRDVEIVNVSSGTRSCIDDAMRLQPDCIVLDLMVPNPGGTRLAPMLRRACPTAKIYVFSSFDIMRPAVEKYVDDFFTKSDWGTLLDKIEASTDGTPTDTSTGETVA